MEQTLYVAAGVIAVTAAVAAAARRLALPSPILLVLAGLVLAFMPGLPTVALGPDLVLLLFLPPIIYYAAFGMSWRAFCDNLRPIVLLAVGCVIFTATVVAAVAHWFMGLPWAVGFVLGAVVSPPDVVAPLAIARRLNVPKRIVAVLEGEGLVNNATALVLFGFALTAVATGAFSPTRAAATFAAVLVGETLYGLGLGWAALRLRTLAHDPRIEVTLSLLTPFLAFWLPHALGGSGVLATVTAGLFVGFAGVDQIRANTRLQAVFFWDFVTYLIEGAVFLLTGLQARTVLSGLDGYPLGQLLLSAAVISLAAILVRFVWVFPATYLPRLLLRRVRERDPYPPWQYPFMIAFTGVRGVVSLAAALSIPFAIGAGQPFPDRNLVLFLTFSVILVTLVGQGLTLPALVRALGLVERGRAEERELKRREARTRVEAARAALARLGETAKRHGLPLIVHERLSARHRDRLAHLERHEDHDGDGHDVAERSEAVELALIATERRHVNARMREGAIGDDIRRRIERDLDLREEQIRRNVRGVAPEDD
jgi:monovalent cation/hydrogen antiporter